MREPPVRTHRHLLHAALIAGLVAAFPAAAANKTLVYCSEGSPEGFQPQFFSTGTTFDAVSVPMFNRLVEFETGTTNIIPALAESWTVSPDSKVVTFKLRHGVKFHSNANFKPTRDFNADDVIFSWTRMADDNHPFHKMTAGQTYAYFDDMGMKNIVDKVEAVDKYTVRFTLKEPFAWFLDMIASPMAGAIIARECVEKFGDLKKSEALIGTGPWMLDSYRPNVGLTLVRHPQYFGAGLPYIDRVELLVDEDNASRTAAFLGGKYDLGWEFPGTINRSDWVQIAEPLKKRRPGLQVAEFPSNVVNDIFLRADKAPFSDVRVRQALRLIVDRQQMIDQALNGFGILGNDMYSPFDPAYAKDLPQRMQDIDQAKSLLKQAGQEDLDVELVTSSAVGAGAVESANLFVEQAKKAGVSVRLNKADANVFYGDRYLSWNFAQDFWNTRNYIPQVATSSVKGGVYNETHFDDPTFTALINKAKAEPDEAKRNQLLHDAQKIEYDTGGFIIWGFKRQLDAYSNLVQGLQPHRYLPCSNFGFKRASFVTPPT